MVQIKDNDLGIVIAWAVHQQSLVKNFAKDMLFIASQVQPGNPRKETLDCMRKGLEIIKEASNDDPTPMAHAIANFICANKNGAIVTARVMTRGIDLDKTLEMNEHQDEGDYLFIANVLRDIHAIDCHIKRSLGR